MPNASARSSVAGDSWRISEGSSFASLPGPFPIEILENSPLGKVGAFQNVSRLLQNSISLRTGGRFRFESSQLLTLASLLLNSACRRNCQRLCGQMKLQER
jgi:hypothetical protein